MASVPEPPAVGQPAPVQGQPVELAAYRGRRNVVVWFSRGFTCPFCRVHMDGMREGYELHGRSAVASFSYAYTHGNTGPQLQGAWLDVMNRNFVRRLHHHAMTAMEQGILLIDRKGVIRHRSVVGPLDPVPRGSPTGRAGPVSLPRRPSINPAHPAVRSSG